MGFAEAKAACEGRAIIVETNTRTMVKAGKIGAIESLLPGAVGTAFQQSYRQQSKAREAYKMLRNWVFAATNVTAKRGAGQSWLAGHYKDKPEDTAAAKKRRRKNFFDFKSADQPGEVEHDKNHPVLWLLDKPNKVQGHFEFVYITIMNLLLTGEWYWIGGVTKDGKAEVWAVPSSWIVPDHSKGMFSGYKLVTGYAGEGIPLAPENVARGYFPDPSDIKGCLSPLQSCTQAARIDEFILGSQEATFERGINPNVVIKVGQSLGPDGKPSGRRPTLTGKQQAQLRRAIQYMWNKNLNNGMPAIIDGIVEDIFKLQNTPQEMDWGQSGEVVKARIFQAFGVNAIVVGEITPSNKAQAVVAETNFCGNVVNPILGNISRAASEFFTTFYDDGESLAVWLEEAVPKDDEREDRQWNQARQNNDITQEENRARLKLEPLPKKPPERSPLLNNPQTMAAIANLCAQVSGGMIPHDAAVNILVTTLQISPKDAEAMVPDDPPEPSPEELAAAQAAQQQSQQPPGNPGGKPPAKPAKDFSMVELAKELAGMLTIKWEEEQHPRDEGGRFTDSPGQSMLPGLEDANKPGDNPKASLKERAAYAVRRSEKLAAEAEENGETVKVWSSWDDLDDTAKNEAQDSWTEDHLSEFEEPLYDEWLDSLQSDTQGAVEGDEDFAKEIWLKFAEDRGYSKESAEEAFDFSQGEPPIIDSSVLKWNDESDGHKSSAQDDYDKNAAQTKITNLVDEYQSAVEDEVERRVQEEKDNGPPDSVTTTAYEQAQEAFNNLSEEDKTHLATGDAGFEQEVQEPKVYQPISDGRDYEKTRTVVRYLQNKIMDEELAARGIQGADKVDEEKVAAEMWSDWKGSSTSSNGLLLQYATAQELGGLSQKFTESQMLDINAAARQLSISQGGKAPDLGHVPATSDEAGLARLKWHEQRGIEIAKAHVHATWAATQYALSKANMDHLDVYRGIMLDKKMVEALPKEIVKVGDLGPGGNYQERAKLPTLQLQRYGAASTTTDAKVANSWEGVGVSRVDTTRVVVRVKAPKESIVSIPAFGQNIHDEEEVVLAGAKEWAAWDAWLDKAPTSDKVPIKSLLPQAKRRRMVVVFEPKYNPNHAPAGSPEGGQFTSGNGGSASEDTHDVGAHYGGWQPKFKEKPDAQSFIDARNKSTRGAFLSHLVPDDLKDHKLILSDDKTVGAAVSKQGDVQNVFNNGGPKGAAAEALIAAINAGGTTLDCYNGHLPKLYSQFGFEETGRMKFNRDYAPADWDYDKYGEPDVVFMGRKGGKIDNEQAKSIRGIVSQPADKWPSRKISTVYYDDFDKGKEDSRRAGGT